MEISSYVVIGVLIVAVKALSKVVEYFLEKNKKHPPCIAQKQNEKLLAMEKNISYLKEHWDSFRKLEHSMDMVLERVKHLDEIHSVYNDDHVPSWYVPKRMLPLLMDIEKTLDKFSQKMEEDVEEMKDNVKKDHAVLADKIVDLISSNRLTVERIGDLISELNKKLT